MSNTGAYGETQNKLTNFDLALSISEKAINYQLQKAWRLWRRQTEGGIEAIKINPKRQGRPSKTNLDAVLGTPSLSLSTKSGGPRDVRLRFPLVSGTISYRYDDEDVVDKIDNWIFTVDTVLDRAVVSLDTLYAQDPATGEQARGYIGRFGLGEGAFSIECLFLSLTGVQMIKSAFIEPNPLVPSSPGHEVDRVTLSKVAECMAEMMEEAERSDRKFILGTTVYPRRLNRTPSFTLQHYFFKVTRTQGLEDFQQSAPNTLDYLGVFFEGLKVPQTTSELDNAYMRLGPWLSTDRISGEKALVAGVMVIRGQMATEHFRDGLRSAFGSEYIAMAEANRARGEVENPGRDLPHPEAELLHAPQVESQEGAIRISNNKTYNWTSEIDGDTTYLNLQKSLWFELKAEIGKGYTVDGELTVSLHRNREKNIRNSRASATTTAKLTGTVELQVGGGAVFCNIVPKATITFGSPVEQHEVDQNWLSRLFNNNDWDVQEASGFAKDSRTAIEKMLKRVLESIDIAMDKFALIPPGEDVFTFSSPRFTAAHDLMLDVIYKAPKAVN